MTNYKLKLKALLHDPIDKQYVMWKLKRNHEDVAIEYLNKILYGETLKEGDLKDADTIASAVSRIVVLPKDERIKKIIEDFFKPEWEE
ncbi:MAG: hypothetical protein NC926_11540, partial [Candidatus Omnitrophica bacterium]|nr:hypothetical protein [Candidatus Omnitrophota bacterium]